MTWHDPIAQLERLAKDKLEARAEICEAMERLGNKHGISLLEVSGVMLGYLDDVFGDLTFELEEELRQERDEAPKIG